MAELTANGNLLGAAKLEEPDAAVKVEISLLDDFGNTLSVSQPSLVSIEPVCELDTKREICEAAEKDVVKDEEPTVIPPASTESTKPKVDVMWTVGAQCQAVWSEDGIVYDATILSVDGDRCRVKFHGYGNEEDMLLSTLKSPLPKTEWKLGSRCRAVYSDDGLVYPAVVLCIQGQRCRVKFDDYNNEEEVELSSLLSPDELNGPARGGRQIAWRNPAFQRRRRDGPETSDKRVKPRNWKEEQNTATTFSRPTRGERNADQTRAENDEEKPSDKTTNHIFSMFPPFPPFPPPPSTGDVPTFIPPPPSPWAFGGKEASPGLDATSNMLMLWYMCGFHTGSYLAQQKSSSRE